MDPRLSIVSEGAAVRELALPTGRTRVVVGPADQFRLLLAEPGAVPPTLRALRIDNALVVTGLPGERELELSNFFGACRPGRDCALEIGADGSAAAVAIGNESAPIAALSDGSFLLFGPADGLATLPTAVVPATEPGTPSPWLMGLVGLLGLGAAAGAGGGGGGGDDVAVLGAGTTASPTATTPPVATTPTAPSATEPPSASPQQPAPPPTPAPPPAPPLPPEPPPPDATRPTLTITDDVPAATTNAATTFTFRFDESVVGFERADVRVTGGQAGDLVAAGDGRTWSLTVTPDAGVQSGRIGVEVAADAARDAAGNASVAADASQAYDTAAPSQRLSRFRVTDDVQPTRGEIASGQTTNDARPTVTLTLDRVLGSGETLTLTRDDEASRTLSGGRQSLSFTEATLSQGPHAYTASISDSVGNVSVLDLNGTAPGTAFTFVVLL